MCAGRCRLADALVRAHERLPRQLAPGRAWRAAGLVRAVGGGGRPRLVRGGYLPRCGGEMQQEVYHPGAFVARLR